VVYIILFFEIGNWWQIYIKKIMAMSERIDSFFKRKACDEEEKNASTSSKIEKLHENPRTWENEK